MSSAAKAVCELLMVLPQGGVDLLTGGLAESEANTGRAKVWKNAGKPMKLMNLMILVDELGDGPAPRRSRAVLEKGSKCRKIMF